MARILYVEDATQWVDIVRSALQNHQVDVASSFAEAVDALASSGPYELAMVDLNLIGHDDLLGGEVLDILRREYPNIRRVVITGSPPTGPMRANIFDRYGVEEIIIKGQFRLAELRGVVAESLARSIGELPQDIKLRRSELRQRLRDWIRGEGTALDEKVKRAEEYAASARKLHDRSAQRAQKSLVSARALRSRFVSETERLDQEVQGVKDLGDAIRVAEELDRVEAYFSHELGRS